MKIVNTTTNREVHNRTIKAKSERVDLRLEPTLKDMFESAAFAAEMTLSSFMKAASKRMAEEVLEREQSIRLSAQEHDKFMNLLATPARLSSRMQAAISNVMNGEFEIEIQGKAKI